jgi:hypothetical protein
MTKLNWTDQDYAAKNKDFEQKIEEFERALAVMMKAREVAESERETTEMVAEMHAKAHSDLSKLAEVWTGMLWTGIIWDLYTYVECHLCLDKIDCI